MGVIGSSVRRPGCELLDCKEKSVDIVTGDVAHDTSANDSATVEESQVVDDFDRIGMTVPKSDSLTRQALTCVGGVDPFDCEGSSR